MQHETIREYSDGHFIQSGDGVISVATYRSKRQHTLDRAKAKSLFSTKIQKIVRSLKNPRAQGTLITKSIGNRAVVAFSSGMYNVVQNG